MEAEVVGIVARFSAVLDNSVISEICLHDGVLRTEYGVRSPEQELCLINVLSNTCTALITTAANVTGGRLAVGSPRIQHVDGPLWWIPNT